MGSGSSARDKYAPAVEVTKVRPAPATGLPGSGGGGSTGSSASAPAEQRRAAVRVGTTVRLCDLKASTHLNGAPGYVVAFEPEKGRWTVRLEGGEEIAVKPDNMIVEPVQAGSPVRVTGLEKESILNGLVGIAESYDPNTGRWTVKLSGDVKKALKPQNLVALARPSQTQYRPSEQEESEKRLVTEGRYHDLEGSPLFIALRCGALRLVRGAYLRRRCREGLPWQRRQELEVGDLWEPAEAAAMWSQWRSNFFIAVSYPWLSRDHSDPEMYHLQRLGCFLEHWHQGPPLLLQKRQTAILTGTDELDLPPDVGVFLDFCCLHQQEKGGVSREVAEYQAAVNLMGFAYGHEHTTVLRLTGTPVSVPRKYHLRGWACLETCLAANKAFQDNKLFTFGDYVDPAEESPTRSAAFWRKFKQSALPPCSQERFSDLLLGCERGVKLVLAPHNQVFTEASDKPLVLKLFREAWEEQRQVREFDFKNMGWHDVEAAQLASSLASFGQLEAVRLTGNRIGDVGAEALLAALSGTKIRILDLGDNDIGPKGAGAMSSALPSASALRVLVAFANPFCSDETSRWQLITAWGAAGKDKSLLALDHFALRCKSKEH